MAHLLKKFASKEDIIKARDDYISRKERGDSLADLIGPQFNYGFFLVRSVSIDDMKHGISLLNELYEKHPLGRKNYILNLAVGHAKMKQYDVALQYCLKILRVERDNLVVLSLKQAIEKEMAERERFRRVSVIAGFAFLVGSIALGLIYFRK